MRGIPSSLTEVESQSASDLGNFYPIPCAAPAGPTPPGEPQVEYAQTGAQPSKPPVGNFDKYIDWDTNDVQDRLHVHPVQSRSLMNPHREPQKKHHPCGKIDAWCQNVSSNPKQCHHQEDTPVTEEKKTQKDENTPTSKEQSTPVAEDDVVVLYAGVEDL